MSQYEKYSLQLQLFGFALIIVSIFYTAQSFETQTQDSEVTLKERSLDYVNSTLNYLDKMFYELSKTKIMEMSPDVAGSVDVLSYPKVSEACNRLLNKLEIIRYTISVEIYDKEILDKTMMRDLNGFNPYLTRCIAHYAYPFKEDYPLLLKAEYNKALQRTSR